MKNQIQLPLGIRFKSDASYHELGSEGFELALLDDCDNAYRFTAVADRKKVSAIFSNFSRFLPDEAFFILEYYPDETLVSRPSDIDNHRSPAVFYSPYLETGSILNCVSPYLNRLIEDGLVGFGLANNRKGLEFFYSEEKILTFFTDNHLRLCNFLYRHDIRHNDDLILPSEYGHDHLSLLSFSTDQLPDNLSRYKSSDLDANNFCGELIDRLDMYQVEEGLSFFLTRKEQDLIAKLVQHHLPQHEFSDVEFGGLLLDWSDFVSECENGFEGDLWEYKQGLKIRDAIQLVIEIAPQDLSEKIDSIVKEPDTLFRHILTDKRKRLDFPNEFKITQERFWYHGVVSRQNSDLRRDLIRHGWFNVPK